LLLPAESGRFGDTDVHFIEVLEVYTIKQSMINVEEENRFRKPRCIRVADHGWPHEDMRLVEPSAALGRGLI
jgi:hypothetical protein